MRDGDRVTFRQARSEALRWMREDSEVEVQTEQVHAAPSPTCQELKGAAKADSSVDNEDGGAVDRIAAITRTSTAAQPVCRWYRKPGHFQHDCRAS